MYSSPGKTNARGVSTLLGNNVEYKIMDFRNDDIGNCLALKIEISNQFTI